MDCLLWRSRKRRDPACLIEPHGLNRRWPMTGSKPKQSFLCVTTSMPSSTALAWLTETGAFALFFCKLGPEMSI